jgi:ATP-binding protein involved in chromosome partitioning
VNEVEQQVRSAIGRVTDPEVGRSLDELAMVESVAVAGNAARVHIQLPTPAYPQRERIAQAIETAARSVGGITQADVQFTAAVARARSPPRSPTA